MQPVTITRFVAPLALAALVIGMPPVAAADEVVRTIEDSFDSSGLREVYLDVPVGEVEIEGTGGDRVSIVVELECDSDDWGSSSCPERAERIEVSRDTDDDRLELSIEGYSKWRNRGLQVKVTLQVPEQLVLTVDMGIGDLTITDMRNDVTVDMGIGEASIRMRAADIGRVALDTGVGETSLRTPEGKHGASGLFTSEVNWSEATGEAKLKVDLGIGEIDVRLQ